MFHPFVYVKFSEFSTIRMVTKSYRARANIHPENGGIKYVSWKDHEMMLRDKEIEFNSKLEALQKEIKRLKGEETLVVNPTELEPT